MELTEFKNLLNQTFTWENEIERLDREKEKNVGFDHTVYCVLKEKLKNANTALSKYTSSVLYVPASILLKNLNQFPGYEIKFRLAEKQSFDHHYSDNYICNFSFYLTKDEKDVGELLSKTYDTEYCEGFEEYITSSTDYRSAVKISDLVESAEMVKRNFNPEITEFLRKPEVQNALWQTISENIKNMKKEKFAIKQANVESSKRKLEEAKAEYNALQAELTEFKKDLDTDEFSF